MMVARKFITTLFIAAAAFMQVACQSADDPTINTNLESAQTTRTDTKAQIPAECTQESITVMTVAPYQDNNNRWWMIGQVQNTLTEDMSFTSLCIHMESPSQDEYEVWLLDTTVRASEIAPFRALINSPHVSNKTRFKVTAHAADPSITMNVGSDALGYREMKSSGVQVTQGQAGLQFNGKLTNTGKISANNIRVVIAIFDKANQLIGVADGSVPELVEVESLKPGAEVGFTASTSYLTGKMERYEVAIIEGRSIEAVRGFQK